MGKVIAFDRNRLRSKAHTSSYTEGLRSQAGTRGFPQIHPFPHKREDIAISVVVPVCHRPHLLSHCLASLLLQQFDAARYEIIVVDDKPCLATRNVVNDWARHASRTGPAISYVAGHGNGAAAACNRGWRAARGAIVAFIDGDAVARPDWLQKSMQSLHDDVEALWGCVTAPHTARTFPFTPTLPKAEAPQTVATANYFVRKAVLEEIGGFDERFRFAWGQEADLYFRLAARRARIVHYPYAIVSQPSPPIDLGSRLAMQRSHQAEALLCKKHPQLYRHKMRKTSYGESYLIVAALLLALVCALGGAMVLAAASAALWAVLTLRLWGRQWRAVDHAPLRLPDTLFSALLIPPLAVFWHGTGLLRFRRITS